MTDLNELLEALYQCEDVWTPLHDLLEYLGEGYGDGVIQRTKEGLSELKKRGLIIELGGSRYKLTERAYAALERGLGI